MSTLLRVEGLGVSLRERGGARELLADIGFGVSRGEVLGVVGGSGAGKSTLAHAILRLLPQHAALAAASSIRLGDTEITTLDDDALRAIRGRRIALVHQEPLLALNPAMTVGDQLVEALRVHQLADRGGAERLAAAALDRVGIPDAARAMRRFPHEFSGGMRQRALIAAAVVLGPELLIADEPTTALDVTLQAQVLDLLDDLRRETGMAMLLISHDLDVVAQRCERVLVLEAGRIAEAGPTNAILESPRSEAGARLVAARRREDPPPPPRAAKPAPLLEVSGLSVRYAPRRGWLLRTSAAVDAVTDVSLRLGHGESLGIVGESGGGKSSLARAIVRLGPHSVGRVLLDGDDVLAMDERALRALRRRVQYIPQDAGASLTPHRSVAQLVGEVLEVHGLATRDTVRSQVDALLRELGLPARAADARPAELSAGERQRVAIARAIAVRPELLVCDEPVASVDAALRASLLDLLDGLRRDHGIALLVISHDLAAVRRIAERIAVMHLGRIIEEGPTAEVLASPRTSYTKALLAAEPTGQLAR